MGASFGALGAMGAVGNASELEDSDGRIIWGPRGNGGSGERQ